MFEACFSEYVFNSLLFALWENKAFSGVIPEAKASLLFQYLFVGIDNQSKL